MSLSYNINTGEEWQALCDKALHLKFNDEGYQKVADTSNGDCGIEGFTRTGKVFQCYFPEGNYNTATLTKKTQDKINRDINDIKQVEAVRITKINAEYEFEYFANKEEAKSKYGENVETIGIGTKINCLKNGKYSSSTYLTMDQIQTLLSIGFKFNKGIEDKIYKQEICKNHNIDLKINDKIIERISKIELISKIKYLNDKGLALVDDSGQLIDIFSMSSADIENDQRYGVSLENIINIYGKGMDRK